MRSVGVLLAATWSAGCLVNPGAYACDADDQCVISGVRGSCEMGHCAFADPDCESELRYHEYAPAEFAGECVGPAGSTGVTTTDASMSSGSGGTLSTTAEESGDTGDCGPDCGCADAIVAGADHACVVRTDGAVFCWGGNDDGGLGQGDVGGTSAVPVAVALPGSATSAIVAARHVCVGLEQGGVACWGLNNQGQAEPTRASPLTMAYAVDGIPLGSGRLAANLGHTCSIVGGEAVWCWGDNTFEELGAAGELGPFEMADRGPMPIALDGLAVGEDHSCARAQGGVYCWGGNAVGELGVEGQSATATPVAVPLSGPASTVMAGFSFSCANVEIEGDPRRVECWGEGDVGQLGNGGTTNSASPVEALITYAQDDTGIVSMVGRSDGAALVTDRGRVYAWGSNRGEKFGPEAEVGAVVATPVQVASAMEIPGTIVDLGHGSQFLCALTVGGRVWCWGNNRFDQLGPLADGNGGPFEVEIPCD